MPLSMILTGDVILMNVTDPDVPFKRVVIEFHATDVVLSNFMQQFAINEVFLHFCSLQESARVYDRVMSIWRRAARRTSKLRVAHNRGAG